MVDFIETILMNSYNIMYVMPRSKSYFITTPWLFFIYLELWLNNIQFLNIKKIIIFILNIGMS